MITQQQTEAFLAVEHLYQCIADFIEASKRASEKYKECTLDFPELSELESDLFICEAYSAILKRVHLSSFKTIHVIAQHLEEF